MSGLMIMRTSAGRILLFIGMGVTDVGVGSGKRFNKRHVPARHAEAVADVGLQPGQQSGRQGHNRVLMVVSIYPMAAPK